MDLNEDIIEITTSQKDIITKATLTDLLNLQPENHMGKNFSCIASITKINVKQGWYYKACTICRRKLLPRGPKFACDDHGDIDEPTLRYCLTATLFDESNIASTIFFDEAVTSLLQRSCIEMVITKGFTDAFVLPEPLQLVLGKKKTFHLQLRDRLRQKSSNFVATQVVHNTDTEINVPPPLLLTPPTKLHPQQAATPELAEERITRGKKRIFQSTASAICCSFSFTFSRHLISILPPTTFIFFHLLLPQPSPCLHNLFTTAPLSGNVSPITLLHLSRSKLDKPDLLYKTFNDARFSVVCLFSPPLLSCFSAFFRLSCLFQGSSFDAYNFCSLQYHLYGPCTLKP